MAEGRQYPRSQQGTRGFGGQRGGNRYQEAPKPTIVLDGIQFTGTLDAQLFNELAKRCAKTVGENERRNKPSQLRRFYDELVMWTTKVEQAPDKFEEYRPFILMLNAKAAYADGRELIDCNFVALLEHCLRQVEDTKTLGYVKLFFEAFLGFYKEVRPRDN